LHNHDYDCKKGIQALVKCPIGPKGIDRKWSEDDQKKFIKGLRQYGKNFYRIRKEHLPLKETGDLVEYYYLWKKTPQAQNSRPRRRIIREGKSNSSSTLTNSLTSSTSSSSSTPTPGKRGGKTIVKIEPTISKENNTTTTNANTNSGNSSGGSDDENNETDDSESTTITTTTAGSLSGSSITYCRHCQTTSSKDFQLGGRDNHLLCYDCRMYYKKYGELPIIHQDNQNKEPPPFLFKPVNQSEQSSSLTLTNNKRKRNDIKDRKSNRQSPLMNNEHQQDDANNNTNDSTKSTRSKVKKARLSSISRSSPSTTVSDQKSPKSDNSDENEMKNSTKRKTKISTPVIKQEIDEEENTPLSIYATKSITDKTDRSKEITHTSVPTSSLLKSVLGNESMARIDTSTNVVNSTKSTQHLIKIESLDKSSLSIKGSGFLIKTEDEESANMKTEENDSSTSLGTIHNGVTSTTSVLTMPLSFNNLDTITSSSIITPKPVTSMISQCKQEPVEHTELSRKHSIVSNTILYDHTKHDPHLIKTEHQIMKDDTTTNILSNRPQSDQLLSSPCSAFSRTLRTNNNSRSNSTNERSTSSDKKNIISPSNIKEEIENVPQSCSNSTITDTNDTHRSIIHSHHTHQILNDHQTLNSNNSSTNNLPPPPPPPLVPDSTNESEDGDDHESVENDHLLIDDGPSPGICETVFLNKSTANCIILRTYDRLQNSCARTDLVIKRYSSLCKKKHQPDTSITNNRTTPISTPFIKQEERTPSKLPTLADTKPILNHDNDLRRSSPLFMHNGKLPGYPYGDTSALRQLGDIAMRSMNPAQLLQPPYGARFDRPLGLDPATAAFILNDRYRNLSPFNALNPSLLPPGSSSQTYPTHSHAHIHSHSHTHLHVNDPHTIPPQLMGLHAPLPGLPHAAALFHSPLVNIDALHLSRDRDFMAYVAAANAVRGGPLDPLLAPGALQMPRHEELGRLAMGARERTLHNDNEFRRIHLENERQQRLHYLATQHQQDEMHRREREKFF
ncbi:unnamed protein product, partial [Didymodactylos carnosus]